MIKITLLTISLLVCKSLEDQPNVLLIVVDDLRPNLGIYGYKNAFTPNIDKFSQKSIVFNNVFSQQALCAPSRNSFLTSRRPDTLHLYDFYSYWRDTAGNFTTLPQYFKLHSYHTHSIGKIFHPGISSNFSDDSEYSWSEKPFHPQTEIYENAKVCPNFSENYTNYENLSFGKNVYCPVIVEQQIKETLPDLESLEAATEFLENWKLKNGSQKFFLAVGFHKPHIPLKFPVEYLKYHPIERIVLPKIDEKPYFLPSVAWNSFLDVKSRDDVSVFNISFPFGKMPDEMAKKIIQGYDASVSYIDNLFGTLLKYVDNNTIIVLTGDHGWNLGENGEFSKFSNFQTAVKVPLIIHVPKLTKSITFSDDLLELVDLFPTLVDLTKISDSLPKCSKNSAKTEICTEGKSFVDVIVGNVVQKKYKSKDAVFYQYPRSGINPSMHPNSDKPKLKDIKIMGYSIRTKDFRYTEWVQFNNTKFQPNWNEIYAKELYSVLIDPNESQNLAENQKFQDLIEELSFKLHLGWKFVKY